MQNPAHQPTEFSSAEHDGYERYEDQPELRPEPTVVAALVHHLAELGVEQSFGVSGGAIALLFDALADSPIALHHFRHETGATFAAVEAYFASNKPTLVFATTGPGTLNALNGMMAAKWDGAKVILVSGATNAGQRGRWATQESSSYTLPQDALYTRGPLFDFAVRMEQAAELPEVIRRLSLGLSRPEGFVAHVCLPIGIQSARMDLSPRRSRATVAVPTVAPADVASCAELLKAGPFAVWVGFGARKAAPAVRALVERSGAKFFCSSRAKGVVSENHPQFLGVTGLGGHETVTEYMVQQRPDWVLVLGTRLGEATSFWDNDLLPGRGFIHVDLDPEVFGTAYPNCNTIGIYAEIGHFLEALLQHFPRKARQRTGDPHEHDPRRGTTNVVPMPARRWRAGPGSEQKTRVSPRALMQAIQQHVVRGSDAVVMGECGNSFAWCNHYLRFSAPDRYRVSPRYGSMGHYAAGVVGAALGRSGKAVAVVGDGSMLMNSEISTAVQYGAQAVWIVLNDAGYGMCRNGHQALGLTPTGTSIPGVDFVGLARAMGADGLRVESEEMLDWALCQALAATGPFVVDVRVDPDEASPLFKRFESLINQGSSKNIAGWEA